VVRYVQTLPNHPSDGLIGPVLIVNAKRDAVAVTEIKFRQIAVRRLVLNFQNAVQLVRANTLPLAPTFRYPRLRERGEWSSGFPP
jgi:hypothetical protein